MYWTSEHDVLLCREVVSENPFKTRKGSSQRSEIWDRIANTLNTCPKSIFAVDKRSVRDHVGILVEMMRNNNSSNSNSWRHNNWCWENNKTKLKHWWVCWTNLWTNSYLIHLKFTSIAGIAVAWFWKRVCILY